MVFKKDDPNYILVGTDGGIYETFDNTENWKFVSNLPITQFYKLAVDDAEPFYIFMAEHKTTIPKVDHLEHLEAMVLLIQTGTWF
jgi:hypothetical protein